MKEAAAAVCASDIFPSIVHGGVTAECIGICGFFEVKPEHWHHRNGTIFIHDGGPACEHTSHVAAAGEKRADRWAEVRRNFSASAPMSTGVMPAVRPSKSSVTEAMSTLCPRRVASPVASTTVEVPVALTNRDRLEALMHPALSRPATRRGWRTSAAEPADGFLLQ